jgi:hypothetical protein
VPKQAHNVSVSLDRVSVPMEEPRLRPVGRPTKNAAKRPITRAFRMAYAPKASPTSPSLRSILGDSRGLTWSPGKGPTCPDSSRISGKTNDFAMLGKRYPQTSNPFSDAMKQGKALQGAPPWARYRIHWQKHSSDVSDARVACHRPNRGHRRDERDWARLLAAEKARDAGSSARPPRNQSNCARYRPLTPASRSSGRPALSQSSMPPA